MKVGINCFIISSQIIRKLDSLLTTITWSVVHIAAFFNQIYILI